MFLSHAGPVNVVMLHTPNVLQILLCQAVALTERFGSSSTDIIAIALRDGGRGNCGNSESNGKCSEMIPGHHGGSPFAQVWRPRPAPT